MNNSFSFFLFINIINCAASTVDLRCGICDVLVLATFVDHDVTDIDVNVLEIKYVCI